MNKAPAFQMYAADIYMDTNEWSAEAFGIYNRLLQHQWVNGSIPKDIKTLAQISFVDVKKMSKRWPEMESKFEFDETNRGRNIRLEETRQKQLQYSEKQREKGKKRAEKMWEGHIAVANTTANTTAIKRLQPKDSSSSSSSTSLKEEKDAPSQVQDAIKYFCEQTEKVKRFKPQITGKDGGVVKRVLVGRSIDRIKAQIDFFLNNEKSEKHITLAAALSADTYNLFMQKSVNQSGKVKYY